MNLVTSPSARPSLRLYTMMPAPPACAARTHSSMPCRRYGLQVQMSEPKTSEPLHSSCTRTVSGFDASGMDCMSPKMMAVEPPMGGRKTERSVRVISSGNMPPVCSNRLRRRTDSSRLKRLAMPGRYQTGSIAHLMAVRTPFSRRISPSTVSRPACIACTTSGISISVFETAMLGCTCTPFSRAATPGPLCVAARCPQGSSATMASGSDQLGKGPI
mmetsp:Transcript_50414/g.109268  ORF Transcript_50414/g.109268 Transcript_50414/m.109268 type:complete len:216 (+) Transcript_50414:1141-1788(+)